ncbi:hypothetical protein [Perlucidibaca aquatica]|uniref:hypothetical protein n=1 Tax=Perlucidibaca aquatica TaxID=1852776 RepID=UPI0012FDCB09|nr:hypothetical protein [Perlucidibaca aquatica]
MSSFFSLFGVLAAAYIMFLVFKAPSYGTQVRLYITRMGTERFGSRLATPYTCATVHVARDWQELLSRLRARGLGPYAAAVVAATWLRDNVPDIREKEELQHMMDTISMHLREEFEEQLAKRFGHEKSRDMAHTILDVTMIDEGIDYYKMGFNLR